VRRGLLIVPLVAICLHRVLSPAFARPPTPLADRWKGAVALQTSPATCSPAAAATLLRAHGIAAKESEMATLCLTGERGTTSHGLFRGLKLKTANTPWDVEAFQMNEARLRKLDGPAILTVRLDPSPAVDPRYQRLWGWTPGVAHSVVFLGFTNDGKVDVADPAIGAEQWSAKDLHVLWHGEGLRLFVKP
jgi:ABC-type bacteriocin/lantibiotic exporter with double-glycine peptidase domain